MNNLFYTNGLKFCTRNDELEQLLKTVKSFSDNICMGFGLDKRENATFKQGKLIGVDTVIMELDQIYTTIWV